MTWPRCDQKIFLAWGTLRSLFSSRTRLRPTSSLGVSSGALVFPGLESVSGRLPCGGGAGLCVSSALVPRSSPKSLRDSAVPLPHGQVAWLATLPISTPQAILLVAEPPMHGSMPSWLRTHSQRKKKPTERVLGTRRGGLGRGPWFVSGMSPKRIIARSTLGASLNLKFFKLHPLPKVRHRPGQPLSQPNLRLPA